MYSAPENTAQTLTTAFNSGNGIILLSKAFNLLLKRTDNKKKKEWIMVK